MSGTEKVEFTPVLDREENGERSKGRQVPTSCPSRAEQTGNETGPMCEIEQARYPLAGPILDKARDRVLRGHCSSCQTQLKASSKATPGSTVQIRCPVCGNTGEVDV